MKINGLEISDFPGGENLIGKRMRGWAAAVALVFLGIASSQATTYQVSTADDTATIQAVLTAAVNGDTVQFAAGTYTITSELLIQNKGITLQGMGKATGTIIQRELGAANQRIFHVVGIQGTSEDPYNPALGTTINGFTVRNGLVAPGENGGNILVKESPYSVIENCIIEDGTASFGGGISLEVGGTVRNSIVRDNATYSSGLNQGGGIYMRYGANYVENSIIYDNQSVVGGGVGLQGGGDQTDPAYAGDGRNSILNSTIANNNASGTFGYYGGGVGSQLQGYQSFVTDSVVTFNLNNDVDNVTIAGAGTLTVTYTNANVGGTAYSGTGNISSDPLFVGTGEAWNFYKLQAGSPGQTASSTSGIIGAVLDESAFVVPEPSSLLLVGLAGFAFLVRRRRFM